MQRAARGLADALDVVPAGELVVALVGPGNNGGDALYAATHLLDRGVRVDLCLLDDQKVHSEGLAAARRRRRPGRRGAHGAALVPRCRARHRGASRAERTGRGVGHLDRRATSAHRGGRRAVRGRRRRRHRARAERAGRRHGHVRHLQGRAAVRPGRRPGPAPMSPSSSTSGWTRTCRSPCWRSSRPTTGTCSARRSPGSTARSATSTPVASSASPPAPSSTPGAAHLAVAGAQAGPAGMVRFVGSPALSARIVDRAPEVVAGAGRVQAWVVGPGGGDDAGDQLSQALEDEVPVVVDASALRAPARDVPRPGTAHPARRRAGRDAGRRARRRGGRPARPRHRRPPTAGARRCC